ncbi:MAG: NAD(P)H-dependent oxidoreductase subunit E [Thermoplasmata archaeon HGW-Thermoplasmata-1]|nr:MAG: NAD(P)H-dependent oxidoreductase subunit E [Thermoplasmata archaeon HGW-Thermoplasmata-1]
MDKLDAIIKEHGKSPLPVLKAAKAEYGHLCKDVLEAISEKIDVPVSRLHGVATFYSMLGTEQIGENVIYVCNSPSCYVNGSLNVLEEFERRLGIRCGETTADGGVTLEKTACIGCCDMAPAILLNGEPCGPLGKKDIARIVKSMRK